jgi:hypothetical protein
MMVSFVEVGTSLTMLNKSEEIRRQIISDRIYRI